ncbi:hypothetical protein [Stenotrophomonas mori]|uniref:Uncharacterized protein n=1 Tax=Stenotrophomonas mori TaxID=2871096 RepID=A0ABT0SE46_9GAMM|nr:hypothetical protein [Stenotrophomonas mori]MCL7713577.1 hypothetical protein [Stenotrophomonas mori]
MHSCRSYRLKELAAAVGLEFRRRRMPSGAACMAMLVAIGCGLFAVQDGMRALAILTLAVLCHVVAGGSALVPVRRAGLLLMLLLSVSVLLDAAPGAAGEDLAVWTALLIGTLQMLGYARRVMQLSCQLQAVVDSVEDAELMALLPPDVVPDAQRWIAGDQRVAGRLALLVPLAALHLALGRCGAGRGRVSIAG